MSQLSFPHAILHIDADAFFVSCEQALHPEYKGRPVIVGRDRGIATSLSYEAKRRGVRRGMTMPEIRRVAAETIMLDSDYETYSLFSRRMFAIMRRVTPLVEEYSIDEGFIDITDLTKPQVHKTATGDIAKTNFDANLDNSSGAGESEVYQTVARELKAAIQRELNITVSVGLAPNKVLAKLAASWGKPDGLAWIRLEDLPEFLREFPVEKLWGVGRATAEYMRTLGIFSAYDLAARPLSFVRVSFAKPHQEIWAELQGAMIYPVISEAKNSFASITRSGTFRRTTDRDLVYAELVKNIENACRQARQYRLAARRVTVFIKTQTFQIQAADVCLAEATSYPENIVAATRPIFERLFENGVEYRATGVVLSQLKDDCRAPESLLALIPSSPEEKAAAKKQKLKILHGAIDSLTNKFGVASLHLGSSLLPSRPGRGEPPPNWHTSPLPYLAVTV